MTEASTGSSAAARSPTSIRLQEDIGLDVLVHGEPERNDMVQYFAERLDGFAVHPARLGAVLRHPLRPAADPLRRRQQARADDGRMGQLRPVAAPPAGQGHADRAGDHPAWSFVRDDQPLGDTAHQVALAIRDEIVDLEAAGIARHPGRRAGPAGAACRCAARTGSATWPGPSSASGWPRAGVADTTQIHTHMCYAEFGDIIDAIAALDADVISVEAARSRHGGARPTSPRSATRPRSARVSSTSTRPTSRPRPT